MQIHVARYENVNDDDVNKKYLLLSFFLLLFFFFFFFFFSSSPSQQRREEVRYRRRERREGEKREERGDEVVWWRLKRSIILYSQFVPPLNSQKNRLTMANEILLSWVHGFRCHPFEFKLLKPPCREEYHTVNDVLFLLEPTVHS